jgi:nitrogen fixation protein FixH
MRVRPFFWIFLTFTCACVLVFAATISVYRTFPMHARIDQVSTVSGNSTSVRLVLTDSEGEPIDQARITPDVYMLAMPMGPQQVMIKALGQGAYLALIHFSMIGSWEIDITAHADGFDATRQSIQLVV